MRAAAFLSLVLLLALPPVSAQPQEGSEATEGPEATSEPNTSPCDGQNENKTACPPARRDVEPWLTACKTAPPRQQSCSKVIEAFGSDQQSFSIRYDVDALNETLVNYRVDGLQVLDSLVFDNGAGKLEVRSNGILGIADRDSELLLHNDGTGLVRFKGGDGSLTFRFPATANVQVSTDGNLARITYANGAWAHWRAERADWVSEYEVVAGGFASLHLQKEAVSGAEPRQIQKGIEERRVAAEVNLGHAKPGTNQTPQVLAYDDVAVQVRLPDTPSKGTPIRVEVSADLPSGRTIVVNIDPGLIGSSDARFRVRYYDVHTQAAGTVEQEVLIRQAAGLTDILDPDDDDGQPEFWLVSDENGLQVLASIPHWSTHALTISILPAPENPDVRMGVLAGIIVSVALAGILFLPRRRE